MGIMWTKKEYTNQWAYSILSVSLPLHLDPRSLRLYSRSIHYGENPVL